jgi:hypothetical protein
MPAIKGNPVLSRRKRVVLQCTICKIDYMQHECRAETSKYCSRECWSKRAHKECKACGTVFGTIGHYGKLYCSKVCSAKTMVGPQAPSWKDGFSLKRERARLSSPLAKWKKSVKERDGFSCVKCGSKEYIHAHHIVTFSGNTELRVDINNGITLCEFCHSVEHGRWIGPLNRKPSNFTGKQAIHAETGEVFNADQ